jgi:hypothetical protein
VRVRRRLCFAVELADGPEPDGDVQYAVAALVARVRVGAAVQRGLHEVGHAGQHVTQQERPALVVARLDTAAFLDERLEFLQARRRVPQPQGSPQGPLLSRPHCPAAAPVRPPALCARLLDARAAPDRNVEDR